MIEKYREDKHSSNKRSRNVLIDFRTDKESVQTLKKHGFNVLFTLKCNNISEPVCGHPDMVLFPADNNLICAPEVYDYYKELFGDKIICGNTELKSDYPHDIAYNICRIKNHAFGLFKHTDDVIHNFLSSAGATQIYVKQGYSKCSISIVSERALITADNGIYTKATEVGFDVLKIKEGFIRLDGCNYGFIGGATGLLNDNLWVVNGELKTHPDGERIKLFIKKYNKTIIELKKGEITDIGTIMQI